MKVLLVYNELVLETINMANSICEVLEACQVETVQDRAASGAAWHKDVDAIIVFGGDGTILRTVQHYAEFGLPVMGVNMGTVGFLSSLEVDEIDQYLPRFLAGDYDLDRRMMLEAEIYEAGRRVISVACLNDVSIKSQGNKMIHFDLTIGGQSSGSQRGDGLIIASPTGSTAYSLSAGGPVLDNDLDAMVVTPMASYFLNKRPIVVAPEKEIQVDLHSSQAASLSIDGQVQHVMERQHRLVVKRSVHRFNLVCFRKKRFFETMERRLRRCEVTHMI